MTPGIIADIKKPLMLTEKQWLLVADILTDALEDLDDSDDPGAPEKATVLSPVVNELSDALLIGIDWTHGG